jgi:hypothetical protein
MARPRVLDEDKKREVVAVVTAELKALETMRRAAGTPSRKVPYAESNVPSAGAGGTKPPEFCPPGFQNDSGKQGPYENPRGQNQRSKVP